MTQIKLEPYKQGAGLAPRIGIGSQIKRTQMFYIMKFTHTNFDMFLLSLCTLVQSAIKFSLAKRAITSHPHPLPKKHFYAELVS